MLVPFSWLKDYVEIDCSAEELQWKLFSCGFEVEELTYLGKDVTGVVTGRILSVEKHPAADRLTVCKIDCGAFGEKQICTAATNVFAGAVVPCALDGATVLHEGGVQKIKSGKLRGEASEGMMCSGEELGINDDFYDGAETNGILILKEGTPLGEDIRKIVGIDDYLFDIAVTANRPDCQSIFGIAREVAAVLKKPLKAPDLSYTAVKTDVNIPVEIKEPKLCPRYIGRYVADVTIGVSPQWMRRRLALCGLRSVSNIVDITNFVLLEMGQPMHAFDRNYLRGGKIVVRRAEEGEKITVLNGKEFTLTEENLLVCDGEGGIALAGIMGGLDSEIKETTEEVFFETAKFARDCVRKTSRALGLRSDSSARYEKGVDAYTTELSACRALHLVQELGCGFPTSYGADVNAETLVPKVIRTSYQKINDLLGIVVPVEEANAVLRRLEFQTETRDGELKITVPPYRGDVEDWPDIAEEIIRMYGYEHLEPTFLRNAAVTRGGWTAEQKQELKFKRVLAGEGYSEACNYSFYSPKEFDLFRLPMEDPKRNAMKIANPIGEDLSVMRTFLAPSMLANIVRNVRRGNMDGKLFELANVYLGGADPASLPEERKTAVLGLWGGETFYHLKGAAEAVAEAFGLKFTFARGERPYLHPGATALVLLDGREVGVLGQLHPAIAEELSLERTAFLCELDYAALAPCFAKEIVCRQPPKFPDVQRDIAIVVAEEVSCADAENCMLHACKALKKAELFDVYRNSLLGAGKKSMAFRLTFAAGENAEKPLSPETVDGYFKKIVANLNFNLHAVLR